MDLYSNPREMFGKLTPVDMQLTYSTPVKEDM